MSSPHDHPPLPPKTGLIEVELTDKLNGERPWAQRALCWITWAPKPMSYVLRGLCMGHCAVRLILFSGFVLYFAETPKPLRYVLYEPGWCYWSTCFHIYDFVLIDNIVALCWATWTLKSINLTSFEFGAGVLIPFDSPLASLFCFESQLTS